MLKLNREQIRYGLKKIPKDHEVVLSAICELGEQDLNALRLGYIHTEPWKRQDFVDGLKAMIAQIQSGEFSAYSSDEEVN